VHMGSPMTPETKKPPLIRGGFLRSWTLDQGLTGVGTGATGKKAAQEGDVPP